MKKIITVSAIILILILSLSTTILAVEEKNMAETFKEIVTNKLEIPQIKLYFTTDLRQNKETLEETLVDFKLVDGKYKMENVELKLLGM